MKFLNKKTYFDSALILKWLDKNWYSIAGLMLLFFGLLRHFAIYVKIKDITDWDYFWVCPLAAVLAGIAFLLRDKFLMTAACVWIVVGPLSIVLFETEKCFSAIGFHHIISVLVLILAILHWKETWNSMGMIFGLISFYAYMLITSNLSNGAVNLLDDAPLWMGLIIAGIAILIFVEYKLSFKK